MISHKCYSNPHVLMTRSKASKDSSRGFQVSSEISFLISVRKVLPTSGQSADLTSKIFWMGELNAPGNHDWWCRWRWECTRQQEGVMVLSRSELWSENLLHLTVGILEKFVVWGTSGLHNCFSISCTELGCSLPYTSLELYAMIQASLQLRLVSVVSLAGRKLERGHEFVRMVG